MIYICGDAGNMAPAVRRILASTYQERKGADQQEAEQWLNEVSAQGRYLVDVWGS